MKTYNENKICFILAYQEENELEECLLYLNMLEVPDGYDAELLTVQQEESIVECYQDAMDHSDARYKVYLDTKTYILNRRFIYDFLQVFRQDEKIAMQGVMGCEQLSRDGVIWHSVRKGNVYRGDSIDDAADIFIEKKQMLEVEAVEHYLMITAEDIPWRSDLFVSAEFAGVAKALEFRRMGYKVVVPPQKNPWVVYREPIRLLTDCETERERILTEYPEVFAGRKDQRILMLATSAINMLGLARCCVELGHRVTLPRGKVRLIDLQESDQEAIEVLLEEGHFDLVITCDFGVTVSGACQNTGVKYLAWVFDSPQIHTYHKSAHNPCNHISVFEKPQFERLKQTEIPHLYYCPLATDVDLLGSANVTRQDEKKYRTDISFVGSLYGDSRMESIIESAPEEIKSDIYRTITAPDCIWDGKNRLYGKAKRETLDYLLEKIGGTVGNEHGENKYFFCEAILLGKMTNYVERIRILSSLAEKYPVSLYTNDKLKEKEKEQLKKIKVLPAVSYETDAPKVYYLSRINLNITSRRITGGLPQRIWDVLACGGFMLTNYQPEIEEYLRIGKDLEVFHDLDELMDKAGYYLTHEDKRLRIALNGYRTVRDHHQYIHRLEPLLKQILG